MKSKRLLLAIFTLLLFGVTAAFAQPEKAAQFQEHKVLAGETAATISDHFHVKKKDFLMLNNFPPDVKLTPGQVVLIKQLKEGEKAVEEDWNGSKDEGSSVYSGPAITPSSYGDSRTHVGKATASPPASSTAAAPAPAPAAEKKTEKPVNSSSGAASNSQPAPALSSKPATTGPGGVQYTVSDDGYHVVEKGQTFYRIALTYHLTVDKLKELNNMTNTNISVGQKLKVK